MEEIKYVRIEKKKRKLLLLTDEMRCQKESSNMIAITN